MRSLLAMIIAGMLCAGCALVANPAKDLLDQADMKLAAEDYEGAAALYADLIAGYPNDGQAQRARAIRKLLEDLRSAETELGRSRTDLARVAKSDELPKIRRELADRQSEVNQLRAEMSKLRADLERLRAIDLQDIKK